MTLLFKPEQPEIKSVKVSVIKPLTINHTTVRDPNYEIFGLT